MEGRPSCLRGTLVPGKDRTSGSIGARDLNSESSMSGYLIHWPGVTRRAPNVCRDDGKYYIIVPSELEGKLRECLCALTTPSRVWVPIVSDGNESTRVCVVEPHVVLRSCRRPQWGPWVSEQKKRNLYTYYTEVPVVVCRVNQGFTCYLNSLLFFSWLPFIHGLQTINTLWRRKKTTSFLKDESLLTVHQTVVGRTTRLSTSLSPP